MRGGIDEVTEGDECGGESNSGSVESGDENLGVRVKGVGYFKVVSDEGAEPMTAEIGTVGHLSGDSDVRTSQIIERLALILFW